MNGFQITFYTQQDRSHQGQPLAEWLVQLACEMQLPGATQTRGTEGFGKSGRIRSARFFDLSDQPLQVTIIADADDTDRLFQRLIEEDVSVFYVKLPVEFGSLRASKSS